MTVALSGLEVARQIAKQFPEAVAEITDQVVLVKKEFLFPVAEFLKNSPELQFDYLNSLTAVDYYDYFELVYHLTSVKHNHSLVLKTRCHGRDNLAVASVVSLWRGADYQEREIYDLLGVTFEGHPNLRRIMLWEGFQGHPLRKDYL